MKDMTIQASSTQERNYKVLDSLSVGIRVEENPYSLPPESIFGVAARNNPKRSFLFVSKLIGKHIPVLPHIPLITGFLLASRIAELMGLATNKSKINEAANVLSSGTNCDFQSPAYQFPGKALFIGFAETATALGHAVFNNFTGNVNFLHTTRENLTGTQDTLYFTEDHCHAPDQRCLISDTSVVADNDLLVLIDDEITTGNTCLNIIRTLQKRYPQKRYAILTILDWRSAEAITRYGHFEEELGIKISVLSLLKGCFWHQGESPVINIPSMTIKKDIPFVTTVHEKMRYEVDTISEGGQPASYLGYTGRFGVDVSDTNQTLAEAQRIGLKLSQMRKGKKTLCLGTGEFMYIPFLIANYMGENVLVQSTTRSPVHLHNREDYAVKHSIAFEDPFRPGIKNFIYNIPPNCYEEVFVFWERQVKPDQVAPFVQSLKELGIEHIVFVTFCN
ncbi:phosphoribosyltransferase family protein [Desulforamulus aeronauticus]|uniref:TRSP domain C terminus to PRTase_2 n=1 Tax=Desulforamulus aeronauticus DSM 10349 TaxID=1121421 RepID=A0A1M6NBR9_9FIRM|nr:phosphoribosyltransferase family protein [Desulforamulus aeronauticus]SHJ93129.1 TRSP domain C terminus to PRTase_2 [Desulforamulus aeronauticus DSM 10349]